MRNTIMTEKIARRGVRVPAEYAADFLDQVLVRDCASRDVVTLDAADRVDAVRVLAARARAGDAPHRASPCSTRSARSSAW